MAPLTWPATTASWVCRSPSMTAPCRHQHLRADPDGPADSALDPHDALGLEIADHRHVAGDDREGYLVGAAAAELVPLLVPRRVVEDPHQLPSLTMVRGSSETPFWRISKCRCGAVERPVLPLRPMTWPGATEAPGCDQDAREVAVHRLVVIRMIEQHEQPVLRVLAELVHGAAAGGADQTADWRRRCRFRDGPRRCRRSSPVRG